MCKMDLALNNLQWLICTKSNQTSFCFKAFPSVQCSSHLVCNFRSLYPYSYISIIFSLLVFYSKYVFHWSVSDNKPLQICRTLRSILADIDSAKKFRVVFEFQEFTKFIR